MNAPRIIELGHCTVGEKTCAVFVVTFNNGTQAALLSLESEHVNTLQLFEGGRAVFAAIESYDRHADSIRKLAVVGGGE